MLLKNFRYCIKMIPIRKASSESLTARVNATKGGTVVLKCPEQPVKIWHCGKDMYASDTMINPQHPNFNRLTLTSENDLVIKNFAATDPRKFTCDTAEARSHFVEISLIEHDELVTDGNGYNVLNNSFLEIPTMTNGVIDAKPTKTMHDYKEGILPMIIILSCAILLLAIISLYWLFRKKHRREIVNVRGEARPAGNNLHNEAYLAIADLDTEQNGAVAAENFPEADNLTNGANGGHIAEKSKVSDRTWRNVCNSATLNYVELSFNKKTPGKRFRVQCSESSTPYADIDFSVTADPVESEPEACSEDSDFMSIRSFQSWQDENF